MLKDINKIDSTLFLDTDLLKKHSIQFNSIFLNKMKELRFDNSSSKLTYTIFSNCIMISANESATVPFKRNSGWYNLSTNI